MVGCNLLLCGVLIRFATQRTYQPMPSSLGDDTPDAITLAARRQAATTSKPEDYYIRAQPRHRSISSLPKSSCISAMSSQTQEGNVQALDESKTAFEKCMQTLGSELFILDFAYFSTFYRRVNRIR